MSAPILHVRGRIHVTADEVRDELWVVGGRITYERPQGETETVQGHVLPGLVDAHCHIGLDAHGEVDRESAEQQALADRDAGVTLIRDAGSPADTRWIDQRPDLPHLIRAGRHIARTRRYLPNYAHEIEPGELATYVRQEARRGDGWVKLVGDWIDREVGDLGACWPPEALHIAIRAAHEEGARVTAHCFAEDSLRDFAEAGVDCIEHATGLTEETIPLFAERGIAIVPTLVNIATFPGIAEKGERKYPRYAAHMRDLHERRYATISAAHEAGIPIYCGTDAGGSLRHGLVPQEIAELAKTSLGVDGALDAATWGAHAWLGRPGLEEGADADLLVLADDPREDLATLARPSRMLLRGRIVR